MRYRSPGGEVAHMCRYALPDLSSSRVGQGLSAGRACLAWSQLPSFGQQLFDQYIQRQRGAADPGGGVDLGVGLLLELV